MSGIVRKRPKIHINICTHRAMNPWFVNSMFQMLEYMKTTGIEYEINSLAGVSNLVGTRQNCVNAALGSSCTHMLFVDDDMVFAMNAVHKMLSEMNTLVMSGIQKVALGVNYCRKGPSKLYYTAKDMDNQFLQSKGAKGVVEATACGLGLLLIETATLRSIPAPHFEIVWMQNAALYNNAASMLSLLSRDNNSPSWVAEKDALLDKLRNETSDKAEHQGEDFYFTRKLRDYGVRVFVDQDIAQTIGHAGDFIYSFGCYADDQKT